MRVQTVVPVIKRKKFVLQFVVLLLNKKNNKLKAVTEIFSLLEQQFEMFKKPDFRFEFCWFVLYSSEGDSV